MPKGPQGQKRPADVIGNAVRVMQIATGQTDEDSVTISAAALLGSKGGEARKKNLSASKRKQIAQKAAATRWGKKKT